MRTGAASAAFVSATTAIGRIAAIAARQPSKAARRRKAFITLSYCACALRLPITLMSQASSLTQSGYSSARPETAGNILGLGMLPPPIEP